MKIKYRNDTDTFLLTDYGDTVKSLVRDQLEFLRKSIDEALKEQDYTREMMKSTKGD